jgi:hypothetical protein
MMEEKLGAGITCFILGFVKFVTVECKRYGNPLLTGLFSFSFIINSIDKQQILRTVGIPQPGE